VDTAIDHDHIQLAVVLQDRYILKRIAVDEYAVSIVARLDPTQFMLPHEEFGDTVCGSNDALMSREAEEFGEMLEISGVGAMRRPSESVVTEKEVESKRQLSKDMRKKGLLFFFFLSIRTRLGVSRFHDDAFRGGRG
jgi:hypothetical protein